MIKIILLVFLLMGIAGCTLPSKKERDPSSAGYGRDDMKKSRCACLPIYKDGQWLL